MSAVTSDQTTRALEWMVEKLAEARANGYWLDKVSSFSLTGSAPGGARQFMQAPPAPAPGSVTRADLERAVDRAAQAEAQVAVLTKRLERLEAQLEALEAVWTKH